MSNDTSAVPPRWQNYVLVRGQRFTSFWTNHLTKSQRSTLFILGGGFDPRMCLALKAILSVGGEGKRDVILLEFFEGSSSPSHSHKEMSEQNRINLESAITNRGTVSVSRLEFISSAGQRVSSRNARDLFGSTKLFKEYDDIIVDISAMPRSVYFPMIARLLYLLDNDPNSATINLHVIVSEDPSLDSEIVEEGIDEKAEFMASFSGGFDEEATQTPKVWLPMIGERRRTQLDRIQDLVKQDEVCPILPFPSRNPRRADDIVIECHQFLFDELQLNPQDFLYVSESNPFEVYRQIRTTVLRYNEVFKLLGGCRVAISALSSKLMSMGALLAAYELKKNGYNIGVAHIECQGYKMNSQLTNTELISLWLTGECNGK